MKTAAVFFNEPTKSHYLIEISRKSKLAHTSTKKHLNELMEMNIIKEAEEKKGARIFPVYSANFNSAEYKKNKRIYNLLKLEDAGLIEFLKDKLAPKSIVLFGSYARGEDLEESDIDLFVECKKGEIEVQKYEKTLQRRIQLHFKGNFRDYPAELKNNILNGMVLSGFLEGY
jgi:predicted nucleotidyltransferase